MITRHFGLGDQQPSWVKLFFHQKALAGSTHAKAWVDNSNHSNDELIVCLRYMLPPPERVTSGSRDSPELRRAVMCAMTLGGNAKGMLSVVEGNWLVAAKSPDRRCFLILHYILYPTTSWKSRIRHIQNKSTSGSKGQRGLLL